MDRAKYEELARELQAAKKAYDEATAAATHLLERAHYLGATHPDRRQEGHRTTARSHPPIRSGYRSLLEFSLGPPPALQTSLSTIPAPATSDVCAGNA